jgi:hypothetical protein
MTETRTKTILPTAIVKWACKNGYQKTASNFNRKGGICFIGFCVVFSNSRTKRSVFKKGTK